GSMVRLRFPTNGMRDVVFYNDAILPKVYIPIHQTNAALPTSSLEFKVSYLKQLNQMVPSFAPELRPEARWMVDPDDYVKPLVYDPKDARWTKPSRASQGACRSRLVTDSVRATLRFSGDLSYLHGPIRRRRTGYGPA